MEEEMYFNLQFTKKEIDIIIEELDITGNHQELVDSIREDCELQQSAYDTYCGKNK